ACASSSDSRTACIATRAASELTVTSNARTSRFIEPRAMWSASALSLPLLQLIQAPLDMLHHCAGGQTEDVALPAGRLTTLFTDIEGSTRLLRSLGERYGDVLSEQRAIMRAAIDRFDGHEMSTEGDSFFVVFPTALGAAMAAIEAQRCLAVTQWPFDLSVR